VRTEFDTVGILLALMWVCLVGAIAIYAIRAIRKSRDSAVAVLALVVVAFLGGYAAHRSPPLLDAPRPVAPPVFPNLSELAIDQAPALGSLDRTVTTSPGTVSAAGWIADPIRLAPGAGLFLLIDGGRRERANATYGITRPDVAGTFNDANMLWTGFGFEYRPAGLSAGKHFLQVVLISGNLRRAYVLPNRLELTVAETNATLRKEPHPVSH
jgi:hypothetical protein